MIGDAELLAADLGFVHEQIVDAVYMEASAPPLEPPTCPRCADLQNRLNAAEAKLHHSRQRRAALEADVAAMRERMRMMGDRETPP